MRRLVLCVIPTMTWRVALLLTMLVTSLAAFGMACTGADDTPTPYIYTYKGGTPIPTPKPTFTPSPRTKITPTPFPTPFLTPLPTPTPVLALKLMASPTSTPAPAPSPTPILPLGEQYLAWFKANCEDDGVGVVDGHEAGDIRLGFYLYTSVHLASYSDHPNTIIYPRRKIRIGRGSTWIEAEEWQRRGIPLAADGAYELYGTCLLVAGSTWRASGMEWTEDHEVTLELVPVGDSDLSLADRTFPEGYYYLPRDVYEGEYQIRVWWTGSERVPLHQRSAQIVTFGFTSSAPGKTERE